MRQIADDLDRDYTNLYKEVFNISAHTVNQAPINRNLWASVYSPRSSTVSNGVSEDTGVAQLWYV